MSTDMKSLLFGVAWLIALACPVSVIAVESAAASKPDSVQAAKGSVALNEDLIELKQRNKILEAQLQVTKDYHGSLLDTVHWALGGVFVVVGLLLGFGWFANFRIYERDKEVLRKELNAQMGHELSSLKERINAYSEQATQMLSKSIGEQLQASEKRLSSHVAQLEFRIFSLELRVAKEAMENEDRPALALTKALGVLQLCMAKSQKDVPDIIHFILKKIDEGGRFTAEEITRVHKIVGELPPHYGTLTEKLRTKLIASDIF